MANTKGCKWHIDDCNYIIVPIQLSAEQLKLIATAIARDEPTKIQFTPEQVSRTCQQAHNDINHNFSLHISARQEAQWLRAEAASSGCILTFHGVQLRSMKKAPANVQSMQAHLDRPRPSLRNRPLDYDQPQKVEDCTDLADKLVVDSSNEEEDFASVASARQIAKIEGQNPRDGVAKIKSGRMRGLKKK